MHAVVTGRAALRSVVPLALVAAGFGGCKERVSQAQCDELLGRFAELVVRERLPNASPDAVHAEQAREREEAARDDSFKNCTTELRVVEYRCAMGATSSEALLKCLE